VSFAELATKRDLARSARNFFRRDIQKKETTALYWAVRYRSFANAVRFTSRVAPPLYRPQVILGFSWPTISAASNVTTVFLIEWNTWASPKPAAAFNRPKRFPIAFERSPYLSGLPYVAKIKRDDPFRAADKREIEAMVRRIAAAGEHFPVAEWRVDSGCGSL
jgi:hypothetical protein